MKILFVIGLPYHGKGGVQREAHTLFQSLASKQIEYAVLLEKAVPSEFRSYPLSPADPDKWEQEVRAAIDSFKPQVLHFLAARGRIFPLLRRFTRTLPAIATVHNLVPYESSGKIFYGRNKPYYWGRNLQWAPNTLLWAYHLRSGHFKNVVCHSHFVERQLRKCGCPREKVSYIPLATSLIDSNKIASGPSPYCKDEFPRIACVAGYIHHKGQHDLLRALTKLRTIYPKFHLVLIGEIRNRPYYNFICKLLIKLGLQNNCTLIVRASEEQRLAALRDADIYVQPSHEEGFCLAFLEAALTVRRCIGTTAGAMPEIGKNHNGIEIVSSRSYEHIFKAICRLTDLNISEEDFVKRKNTIEKTFSLENYVNQHIELYRSLIT